MSEWIILKDKHPDRWNKVLVYRTTLVCGYYPGIYIAWLQEYGSIDNLVFFIDDLSEGSNKIRPLKEFSHWMPLPNGPSCP